MVENFNIYLSDLLIDEDFYCSQFEGSKGQKCFDDPQSFYKENGLKDCDPVNQYFLEHPELLCDNKICKFQNTALSNYDLDFIREIINEDVYIKKLVRENINQLIKSQPKEVENLLLNKNLALKGIITDKIIENAWYKISNIALDFYEKELINAYQNDKWLASKVLINYSAFHSKDGKQFNLVLKLAEKNKNLNQKITYELANKFSDSILKREFPAAIFKYLIDFTQSVKEGAYKCDKDCYKKLLNIIKIGINKKSVVIDDRYVNLLEDIYKNGDLLSYESVLHYIELAGKGKAHYLKILTKIVEHENEFDYEFVEYIFKAINEIDRIGIGDKEDITKNIIFILNRLYLKYKEEISNDKDGDINHLKRKLEDVKSEGSERLKRVVNKFLNDLNEIKNNDVVLNKDISKSQEQKLDKILGEISIKKLENSQLFYKKSKYLIEKLNWSKLNLLQIVQKLSIAISKQKIFFEEYSKIFKFIIEYQLSDKIVDREGCTIPDILNDYKSDQWVEKIWGLYKDNNKYFIKSASQIIQELSNIQLNKEYGYANYLDNILKEIKNFEAKIHPNIEIRYDKISKSESKEINKWFVSVNNDSEIILSGKNYQGQQFKYEINEILPEDIKENLLNVLLRNQPYHTDYIKEVEKAYYKIYFTNLMSQIKEVNDSNLP